MHMGQLCFQGQLNVCTKQFSIEKGLNKWPKRRVKQNKTFAD